MADMGEGGGGGHEKGGKKRAKKSSTRVDMTPMVDLAFLLLTFFVLTSTFSKPKVMSLVYPAKPDPKEVIEPAPMNNGITFLLSKDKIFYYTGEFYPEGGTKPPTVLEETNFGPGGVRKLLAELNVNVIKAVKILDAETVKRHPKAKTKEELQDSIYKAKVIEIKTDPKSLKVLIKTDEVATCKNFIDLIDELKIAQIGVIAPLELTKNEEKLIKAKL